MADRELSMLFRHRVSGRAERRLLNRAARCELCGKPMEARDRWLYRAYSGFSDTSLIAAHPPCADAEVKRIGERHRAELAKPLAPQTAMLLAVMMAEEDRMILGTPRTSYDGLIEAIEAGH